MDSINYQIDHGQVPSSSTLSSYPQAPGGPQGGVPHPNLSSPYTGWSQRLPGQHPFPELAPRGPFSEMPHSSHGSLPPLRNTLHSSPGSTMEGAVLPLPMQQMPHTGLLWNHAPYLPYISTFDQQGGQFGPTPPIPDESFLLPPMARARPVTDLHRIRTETPSVPNTHPRARNDRPSVLQTMNPGHQPRHISQHRQQRQRSNTRWLGQTPSLGVAHASVDRRRPRARAELPNPSAYNIHRHSEPGPDTQPDTDGQPDTGRRRAGARDIRTTQSEDADLPLQMRLQDLRSLIAQPRRIASKATLQSMQSVNIETLPEDERTCSICYNEFGTTSPEGVNEAPLRLPKCQHVFGDHCIKKWFKDSDSCPYCRDKLPSEPKGPEADRQFLTMMRLRGQTPMDMPRETLLSLLELSDGMNLYRGSLSPSLSSGSEGAEDSTIAPEQSGLRTRQETHHSRPHAAQPTLRPAETGISFGHGGIPRMPYMVEPQPGMGYPTDTVSIPPLGTPFGLNNGQGGGRNTLNTGVPGGGHGVRPRRSHMTATNRFRQPLGNDQSTVSSARGAHHQPYYLDSYWE